MNNLEFLRSTGSMPGTPTVSTAAYSTFPSPYGAPAPAPAGAVPSAVPDPYAQTTISHPGGAMQVAGAPVGAQPTGQPAGIPGKGIHSIAFVTCFLEIKLFSAFVERAIIYFSQILKGQSNFQN